jgi:hypothetical protein
MGTFEVSFEVPDVATESKSLRLSSVVWANQREPLAAAVGAAGNQKKLLARHPLIHDGQKLVPSITRVFRKDQTLYVYFEVYDPGLDPDRRTPDLAASLSFFRDRTKTFETTPIRISQTTTGRPVWRRSSFSSRSPHSPQGNTRVR